MRIDIRTLNIKISPSLRSHIEQRLLYALGRFGNRIRRVVVRLEDLNGPKKGLDQRCHIETRLAGCGILTAEVRDVELNPAIGRAIDRIARRIRDELTMRRNAGRQRAPFGGHLALA